MAVGIKVGSIVDEIGTSSFFHAFFSTISANLEHSWGDRFPILMNELYQGRLRHGRASAALGELITARDELSLLPPTQIVWDIEDRSARPPWQDNIAAEITSLGNYFVSSTGRDLFELIEEALEAARDEHQDAEIVSY